MADGSVGVKQSAGADRQIDNEVATNDAAATVYRQKIVNSEDFAYYSRNLFGYGFSAEVTATLAAETDLILMRNTGTKAVRLFEQIVSIPDSAQTVRSVLRIYKNPTVTLNGTAQGVGGLRNGQAATTLTVTTLPTISARGTRVQSYGLINTPSQRVLLLNRWIEVGDSLLITGTPSAAGVLHAFSQAWAEVAP